jgi:hypothetical protein
LIHLLMAWIVLAQPAPASVFASQHALSAHGILAAYADADDPRHLAGHAGQGVDGGAVSGAGSTGLPSHDAGAEHGCDHACCHAAAHLLGLPVCGPAVGFPGIAQNVACYRATWRSRHLSPPERPPRAIA